MLFEYDGIKNMTALIREVNGTRWKIVLGSAGDDGFHTEPIDRWSFNSQQTHPLRSLTNKYEQMIRDLINMWSADSFPYQWALHFGISSLMAMDTLPGPKASPPFMRGAA